VKDKIVSIASRVLALEGRTSIERLAFVMRRRARERKKTLIAI